MVKSEDIVFCKVCGEHVATVTIEMAPKPKALVPIRRQMLLNCVWDQIKTWTDEDRSECVKGAEFVLQTLWPMFKEITVYCKKCDKPFNTVEITELCPDCRET